MIDREKRPLARVAELAALGAAVLPAAVMVGRAAVTGWVPLFDAAYFTVRSRDVLTAHNPAVGAWSMGSREVGTWVNNLGPLQLDLLAPFTKLDPYWGTAAGVAATNVAAIVGVWLAGRRLFGTVGAVGAMAATVLIELNEGSLMLIEARQQLALLLPMWCLLWLAVATWLGHGWALPWLVFVASFVLQTHLTYAYQAAAVSAAAVIAFGTGHRRRRPSGRARPVVVAAGVAVVCWVQPLRDQLTGTGNLGAALAEGGGSERSAGFSKGLAILAETAFVPPFFTPGSMGELLREGPRTSTAAAIAAIGLWAAALVAVAALARRHHRELAAMSAVGLVALAGSVWAAIKIPPTEQFGIIAQNYYWAWPIAVFAATAIIAALGQRTLAQLRATVGDRRADTVPIIASGATVVAMVGLLSPTNQLPETDHEWTVSRELALPLLEQFADSLDRHDFRTPVLIDLGAVRHVRYTLLVELQRRRIDFRFSPGTTDIARFGSRRCDDGSAAFMIILRGGDAALPLDGGDLLLASVRGLAPDEGRRMAELSEQFGAALRDGRVTVDDGGVRFLGGDVPAALDQVRDTAGMPARRLSRFLANWRHFGAVTVDPDLVDDLEHWHELERSAAGDRMAIFLRTISPFRADRCGQLAPGAQFLGARK